MTHKSKSIDAPEGARLMYRQGDVLTIECAMLPPGVEMLPRTGDRTVLAHGEATGHAHAFDSETVQEYRDPAHPHRRLINVLEPTALVHEEHAPILHPRSIWEVVLQRVYTPEGVKKVAD